MAHGFSMVPGEACFWSWSEGAGRHTCDIACPSVSDSCCFQSRRSQIQTLEHRPAMVFPTLVGQAERPGHAQSAFPVQRTYFPSIFYFNMLFYHKHWQALTSGRRTGVSEGIPDVRLRSMGVHQKSEWGGDDMVLKHLEMRRSEKSKATVTG